MDGITLEDFIEEQLLILPPHEVRGMLGFINGNRFTVRKGVYVFYNRFHEALYVGISNKVSSRVLEHIQSPKGNPDLKKYVQQNKGCYITAFHEPDKSLQEIYESYLIKTLNPRFNIGKTGRQKYGGY